MGIQNNGGINYLLTKFESYKDFSNKSILMLGVQMTHCTYEEFYEMCKNFDFEHSNYEINKYLGSKIDSYDLFKLIGFSDVKALDISPYEGADIIFDLQSKELPEQLFEKYDFIYDGGTLEHVFDFPTALDNTSKMLKVGGTIIHELPAANWIDHGFYSFSSTVFIDYYKKVSFKLNKINILVCRDDNCDIISPDCRYNDNNKFVQNVMDNNSRIFLVCISTKKQEFNNANELVQSMYVEAFKNFEGKNLIKKEDTFAKAIKIISKNDSKYAIYGMGSTCTEIIDYINKYHNCLMDNFQGIIKGVKDKDTTNNKYNLLDINDVQKYEIKNVIIGSLSHNSVKIYERIKYLESFGINIIRLDCL